MRSKGMRPSVVGPVDVEIAKQLCFDRFVAVSDPLDAGLVRALDAYVDERVDDLVGLVRDLVGFDTVSVDLAPGSEHRTNEEGALQEFVGRRAGRPRRGASTSGSPTPASCATTR